ncbi:MAG: DNA-3-methyladenine glycosylase 2 family protein [Verrucomicrobiota bacterium]
MFIPFPTDIAAAGVKHLKRADPVLRRLIERVGPFQLQLMRDPFRLLVRSILSQQISAKAAEAIYGRVEKRLAPKRISAAALAALAPGELRACGVSPQKAAYLRDLSDKVLKGRVRLKGLARFSDEQIIEELTQVKGIGVWTAHMFLIFCLGRPDVFPHDDLGIRSALRTLYDLKELPDKKAGLAIASAWRPYATLGCWYCWRSLENGPA